MTKAVTTDVADRGDEVDNQKDQLNYPVNEIAEVSCHRFGYAERLSVQRTAFKRTR